MCAEPHSRDADGREPHVPALACPSCTVANSCDATPSGRNRGFWPVTFSEDMPRAAQWFRPDLRQFTGKTASCACQTLVPSCTSSWLFGLQQASTGADPVTSDRSAIHSISRMVDLELQWTLVNPALVNPVRSLTRSKTQWTIHSG
jgi:hypothetical protein